jgi:O-antigen ligase
MRLIKKNQLKNNFLFYYALCLVGLLLAAVNFNSPVLFWVLIGGAVLIIFTPLYILPVYVISSLSSDYFIAGEGLGISRFLGIIVIVGGIIYIFRNKRVFNKKNSMYLVVILTFCLISSVFSLTGSLHPFFLFVQYFAVVFVLSQFRNIDLKIFTQLLVFSSAITILVLAFTLKENLIAVQVQRLTTSDTVNENRFAMMLAQLASIIYAAFLIFNKKRLLQLLLISIILLTFFMLILSGSRSATIGIIISIVLFTFYLFKNQTRKFILPVFVILILGFFFVTEIQKMDIPFLDRFTIENIQSSGGSKVRIDTWKTLVPISIEKRLLFGYGFGAVNIYELARENGLQHSAHNFLIDMFLQIGIFGISLFFSYFYFVAKRMKNYLHNPLMYLPVMILLTSLFNGIGETIFTEKLFWNGIALSWLYMNNLPSNKVTSQPLRD